jgi:hypothetical protein
MLKYIRFSLFIFIESIAIVIASSNWEPIASCDYKVLSETITCSEIKNPYNKLKIVLSDFKDDAILFKNGANYTLTNPERSIEVKLSGLVSPFSAIWNCDPDAESRISYKCVKDSRKMLSCTFYRQKNLIRACEEVPYLKKTAKANLDPACCKDGTTSIEKSWFYVYSDKAIIESLDKCDQFRVDEIENILIFFGGKLCTNPIRVDMFLKLDSNEKAKYSDIQSKQELEWFEICKKDKILEIKRSKVRYEKNC